MKPPHWKCRGCGIIILDCGSAPSTCRFCQSSSGFDYMGYEGDYDLHKETEMYRSLHQPTSEGPTVFIAPESQKDPSGSLDIQKLLSEIKTKEKKKEEMKKSGKT